MSKPRKLRAVYFELRRVFGNEHPALDLLRAAALIVEEFGRDDGEAEIEQHKRSIPLYALPLDEAYADGGWRVLSFERSRDGGEHFEIEVCRAALSREKRWLISSVMWPRPTEMA